MARRRRRATSPARCAVVLGHGRPDDRRPLPEGRHREDDDRALLSGEAQYFSLQGVEQALEVIELARDGLNPDLNWLGVLFNIADMRTVHSREAYESLKEHVGEKLLTTTVRQSIAYAES